MLQPYSICPVCDTPIEEDTIDRCKKCEWVFTIDKELSQEMQCELHKWARSSYELASKSDKDKFYYLALDNRFSQQRDDIDEIKKDLNIFKKDFSKLLSDIEQIKYILTSNEKSLIEDSDCLKAKEPENDVIDREQTELAEEELSSIIKELTKTEEDINSIYYHQPKEFTASYQIRLASITKKSINSNRVNEDKAVILEENDRGNYWIFEADGTTYLVPAENKYINPHSYTTTSTIFEGHNYTSDYQQIQLIKPAIVSIEPNTNPQTWRLQQQGELVFL